MPKQRHRVLLDRALLAITVIFLLGGMAALGLWQNLSHENRAVIIVTSSLGIFACFTGLIYASSFWMWLRRKIWLRVMVVWKENSQAGKLPSFHIPSHLSEDGLRHLAIQVYSRMGYQIICENDQANIQLINPEGQIELVACKQWPDLVELHYVHSLQLKNEAH